MIKKYAYGITSFLINNDSIDRKEREIYVYGFETLIAFIINILVILITGIIFDKFIQTIIFLVCYCPIRQFTGGYHADNYKKCLLIFILIFLINLAYLNNLNYMYSNSTLIYLTFLSYMGIWVLAPIEHRHNPLSNKEKKRYKKIVRLLISIVLIVGIICICFEATFNYGIYMLSVLIWIFIMIKLAIIKKYKEMIS